MNQNIEKFLQKIGVQADILNKLNSEEDEVDAESLASTFVKNQKSVLQNDPELIKSLRDEIRGAELSKIEHKIKKTFNLSSEEIKEKKFDEIIEFAFEKTKTSSDGTSEELQNRILELNKKIKTFEEEIVPSEQRKATEQINKFRQDLALRDLLSKRSLIVGPEVAIPVIEQFLTSNYSISISEKGSLEVKTKDNLNPLNSDGTKVLSFEEIVDNHLNSLQLVKQSNGAPPVNPNPIRTNQSAQNGEKTFNLRGLDRAEQNADHLSKVKEFGQ